MLEERLFEQFKEVVHELDDLIFDLLARYFKDVPKYSSRLEFFQALLGCRGGKFKDLGSELIYPSRRRCNAVVKVLTELIRVEDGRRRRIRDEREKAARHRFTQADLEKVPGDALALLLRALTGRCESGEVKIELVKLIVRGSSGLFSWDRKLRGLPPGLVEATVVELTRLVEDELRRPTRPVDKRPTASPRRARPKSGTAAAAPMAGAG